MERLKVGLLAVIAAALCLSVGRDLVPVAHAQSGEVVCNAWQTGSVSATKPERAVATGLEYVGPIRDWLVAHPGQTVFRSTLTQTTNMGVPFGWVDIVCVR